MTTLDDLFALIGEDVDFIGDVVQSDVPVVSYRWSNSDTISGVKPATLLRWGRDAMDKLGLTNVRWQGWHLRGDSTTGQRTKMTVLSCHSQSIYLLMTAGLPGTRKQAKEINRQIAESIELRARQRTQCHPGQRQALAPTADIAGVRTLTQESVL